MNKRLTRLPKARTGYQVRGSLANDVPAFGGADYNAYMGKASPQVRKTMGAVPREEANLEAEGGETLVGDIDGSTFPSFFHIKGPRHSAGGVPMNLPDDTFIFSDTAAMKITDPKILKMFNKSPKKGGYTPAELSKAYDINKYRKTLQDPEANKMEKKTAEMMIKNYVMKLGALAIAQESKKGFPQGIPVIAEPYMEANKITEADLIPEVAKQQQEQQQQMAQQQMAQDRMMPQEGAPEQMPSGEPIAQPSMEEQMQGAQEMSPEQMQGAPMAMYGMEMGGYNFPFAQYGISLGGRNSNNFKGRRYRMLGSTTPMQGGGFTPNWTISDPNNVLPKTDPKANWVNPPSFNNESEDTGPGAVLRRMYENPEEYYPEQELSPEMIQMLNEQAPAEPLEIPQQQYGGDMDFNDLPEAKYGMPLGVNSNNYMGRTKKIQGSGPFLNREMAKEGLIVGGMLGMPVIMSGGGYIDMYADGGGKSTTTSKTSSSQGKISGEELKTKAQRDKAKKVEKVEEGYEDIGEGYYAKGTKKQVAGEKKKYNEYTRKGPYKKQTPQQQEAYLNGVCKRMQSGDLQNYTAEELAGKFFDKSFISRMKACEKMTGSEEEEIDVVQLEDAGCQCEDPNKPGYQEKDENGKCPCEVEKCYCMDPATGKEVETPLTDGKCQCEEEEVGGGYGAQAAAEMPMQWTPQDERNLANAMRTRTGIEYPTAMTYQYPEVELAKEEWLSKVQGLQGQAASNLGVLAGTAGSAASKQATAASLQGDVAEGIVNAIASTQARNVGTENQERLTNYQGDIAEGQNRQNILNQYMDKVGAAENNYRGELNAKDALTTQMINQGDTNAANIYNLQTDQYAIDPRTGKRVFKGGKPLDPEKPDQDIITYAQELEESGIPEDMQELILKQRLSRYGGPVLQMGGMVYGDMVYPFYYYE
jgi:hypothetical protein